MRRVVSGKTRFNGSYNGRQTTDVRVMTTDNVVSTPVDLPNGVYECILPVKYTPKGISNALHAFNINHGCLTFRWMQSFVSMPLNVTYTGATLVLRGKFSATHFWEDCRRHNVTAIQYIGEMCRYLCLRPKVSTATCQ